MSHVVKFSPCNQCQSPAECAYRAQCWVVGWQAEQGAWPPESVLSEAARLVDGDRQDTYGPPSENHACTAAMWSAYLERREQAVGNWISLDAFDVTMLNVLQKVSRLAHSRTRDSLVDIAGYVRNAELVDEQ